MAEIGNPRRRTRDDVATTALRLLDEVGLPDLTMRRLAAELDVQPSALYHHFANKQALLAALADRIVAPRGGGEASDSAPVDVDVRTVAAELRDGLLAYRDGAEVVSSTLSMGLGADAAARRLADAIAREGCDAETSVRAAQVLWHFILGHVSHEQQRLQYDSLGVVMRAGGGLGLDDGDEAFVLGLDLFLAGLRARVRTSA